MPSIESMTEDALKEILLQNGVDEDKINSCKNKRALTELYVDVMDDSQESIFESAEIDRQDTVAVVDFEDDSNEIQLPPTVGSPAWQDYVLKHLLPGEYFEKNGRKYPKTAGLRRVTQILLGMIVESGPTVVYAPDDNVVKLPSGENFTMSAGRATVVYEVRILVDNQVFIYREAADSWIGNTPYPFSSHPVATASSRAEGRALKKALQLNIHTAEEMLDANDTDKAKELIEATETDGSFDDNAPISGTQKSSITKMSKKLKIDKDKFIELNYPTKKLEDLTAEEGSVLCGLLNRYQSKSDKEKLEIPEEIKVSE